MSDKLGLSVNIFNGASSQISWPFNSMCKFAGHVLGANEDGIFTIGGGNFDGQDINAFFELPPTDLLAPNKKRIRRTHIGLEADGNLKMTVYFDGDNGVEFDVVPLKTGQHGVRVNGTRSQFGRYFQYRFDNVLGSDFSIDQIDIDPIILHRRPSGS